MKITIVADCHLNKVNFSSFKDKDSGVPYKSYDFMKAFEFIIDKNINEIKPDLFVVAGDIYDTHDPSNSVRAFFNKQMSRLVECNIPVILLVGNHDICKKNHALDPLKEIKLRNLRVIEEPKLLKFKEHVLLLYPYSISVERSLIDNRSLYFNFIKESKEKIEKEGVQDWPVIFFGHFGVKGASLNRGTSRGKQLDFKNTSSHDISVSDLDQSGANYVFLGDYHSHQILPTKNCISMYTGSIEKDDVTHKDLPKGFIVYDSTNEEIDQYGKSRFVEYPNCRPIVSLYGNLDQIKEGIEKLTDNESGASVRIFYEGDANGAKEFHLELDKLKESIKNKIQPVHMFDAQKITDTAEEKGKQIEQKIIETGHMTEDEVMDTIEEILKEKNEESEFKILLEMAKDIKKEAKERQ